MPWLHLATAERGRSTPPANTNRLHLVLSSSMMSACHLLHMYKAEPIHALHETQPQTVAVSLCCRQLVLPSARREQYKDSIAAMHTSDATQWSSFQNLAFTC